MHAVDPLNGRAASQISSTAVKEHMTKQTHVPLLSWKVKTAIYGCLASVWIPARLEMGVRSIFLAAETSGLPPLRTSLSFLGLMLLPLCLGFHFVSSSTQPSRRRRSIHQHLIKACPVVAGKLIVMAGSLSIVADLSEVLAWDGIIAGALMVLEGDSTLMSTALSASFDMAALALTVLGLHNSNHVGELDVVLRSLLEALTTYLAVFVLTTALGHMPRTGAESSTSEHDETSSKLGPSKFDYPHVLIAGKYLMLAAALTSSALATPTVRRATQGSPMWQASRFNLPDSVPPLVNCASSMILLLAATLILIGDRGLKQYLQLLTKGTTILHLLSHLVPVGVGKMSNPAATCFIGMSNTMMLLVFLPGGKQPLTPQIWGLASLMFVLATSSELGQSASSASPGSLSELVNLSALPVYALFSAAAWLLSFMMPPSLLAEAWSPVQVAAAVQVAGVRKEQPWARSGSRTGSPKAHAQVAARCRKLVKALKSSRRRSEDQQAAESAANQLRNSTVIIRGLCKEAMGSGDNCRLQPPPALVQKSAVGVSVSENIEGFRQQQGAQQHSESFTSGDVAAMQWASPFFQHRMSAISAPVVKSTLGQRAQSNQHLSMFEQASQGYVPPLFPRDGSQNYLYGKHSFLAPRKSDNAQESAQALSTRLTGRTPSQAQSHLRRSYRPAAGTGARLVGESSDGRPLSISRPGSKPTSGQLNMSGAGSGQLHKFKPNMLSAALGQLNTGGAGLGQLHKLKPNMQNAALVQLNMGGAGSGQLHNLKPSMHKAAPGLLNMPALTPVLAQLNMASAASGNLNKVKLSNMQGADSAPFMFSPAPSETFTPLPAEPGGSSNGLVKLMEEMASAGASHCPPSRSLPCPISRSPLGMRERQSSLDEGIRQLIRIGSRSSFDQQSRVSSLDPALSSQSRKSSLDPNQSYLGTKTLKNIPSGISVNEEPEDCFCNRIEPAGGYESSAIFCRGPS